MKQKALSRLLLAGAAVVTTTVVGSTASVAPSITVTEQRILDQRIQSDVMNVLSRNPMLTGRVVVESSDQVVTLSGHLATPGQVRMAGRDAGGVRDVKHVVNDIRSKLGVVSNN